MNGLAVLLALAAATLFAFSTSLQHHTATNAPEHVHGGFKLMSHLVRRPRWLAGTATSTAAFVLHATALKLGTLAVVQPALVSGLVLALPVRAAMDRRRPGRYELLAAVVTASGLALFLIVARPAGGEGHTNRIMAAILLSAGAVVGFGCARGASRAGRSRLAGFLLGFAAGGLSGFAAGALKLTTNEVVEGLLALVASWPPYVLAFFAIWGMTLNQRAYHATSLSVSLPVFNMTDPVAAIAFGILVFGERLSSQPISVALEAIGLLVMAGGALALARLAPTLDAPPPV